MAKAEKSVEELVRMIERGELLLPEMQRRYVWRSTRVRDLMDSLYRGYPSGAILLWETDEQVPVRRFAVDQERSPYKSTLLLLDGQQRLTSLSAVIRGEKVEVRGRKKPIEILFNLEHPDTLSILTEVDENGDDESNMLEADDEEDDTFSEDAVDSSEDELTQRLSRMAFVVSVRKLERLPHWVKVSDVFKTDSDKEILKGAGLKGFDDPRYEKYSQRLAKLRAIRKYNYRMDVLEKSLSYDEVTEIFVRVNSLGAKLRGSDLALAQITAKWRGSLEVFQKFSTVCAKKGFDLEVGLLLRNLMAFATGQSRFHTVGGLEKKKLESAWKESCAGMEFSMNFLKSNAGIDSPILLSSPYVLIALAYYGHKRKYKIRPKEAARLRSWLLVTNAKGRYSRGSTETFLDQDLLTIREGGDAEALLNRLRLQVGRLNITADELEGRNQRSALFKTMFLAFRDAGACDWQSNLSIDLDHSGTQHRLQFHHIFPKAQLKKQYSPREVDDIANLAFIGGRTNRNISNKLPASYLARVLKEVGVEAFNVQCIPTDLSLLELDNYKRFLKARRVAIAQRLNEFLGTTDTP
jgi:hypothetical protein